MPKKIFKIGQLAKRVGITVRTLHHYDELGLVRPSGRNSSKYRLYNEDDLNRLNVVLFLRELRFSLGEIKSIFKSRDYPFGEIVRTHITDLKNRLRLEQELYGRLERITKFLDGNKKVSVKDVIELLGRMSGRQSV